MRNHNRLFLRLICFLSILIFVVATQVTTAFNRMVQPPEPLALVQFYPAEDPDYRKLGILGNTFDVPVQRIKQEVQELNAAVLVRLEDLPVEQVKQGLRRAGVETVRQAEIWWGEVVKASQAKTEQQRE